MTYQLTPDDPRHGTRNGYNRYHCRCDRCSEARLAYDQARAKPAERLTPKGYAASFSIQPLTAAIARVATKHGDSVSAVFGPERLLYDSYYVALARGRLSALLADRICVRVLGKHPAEIYHEEWFMPKDEMVA